MRADRIVVQAPDDKRKGLRGRRTERLSLLSAARVKINVGMVPGNCAHGALLVALPCSFADAADRSFKSLPHHPGAPFFALRSPHARVSRGPGSQSIRRPPVVSRAGHRSGREAPDAVCAAARGLDHIGGTIPRPTAMRGACT